MGKGKKRAQTKGKDLQALREWLNDRRTLQKRMASTETENQVRNQPGIMVASQANMVKGGCVTRI